jgi:chromosome segregation ATPase
MKNIFRVLVAIIFMLPMITHAAWWNPKDWLRPLPAPTQATTTAIEKIRTIQVDNPTLTTTITSLKAENTNLRAQIATLTALVKQLQTPSTIYTETLTSGCQALKDEYITVQQKRDTAVSAVIKEKQAALDTFIASIVKYNSLTYERLNTLKADLQNSPESTFTSYASVLSGIENRFIKLCPGKSLI